MRGVTDAVRDLVGLGDHVELMWEVGELAWMMRRWFTDLEGQGEAWHW